MKTTLVVMAAGFGTRYGAGIKQFEPVGPNGELILEYSVHDAVEAGFRKVIFVIREELKDAFQTGAGSRIARVCAAKGVETALAFQRLEDLPGGFSVPPIRRKPWGTGAAVLACRRLLDGPFCVINADDYYGRTAFTKVRRFLGRGGKDLCMAGFILGNTLSGSGSVTRGICTTNRGFLTGIRETKNIVRTPSGPAARSVDADGGTSLTRLDPGAVVSMNLWGMPLSFLGELEKGFAEFLSSPSGQDPDAEYLLPVFIGKLLKEDRIRVRVLPTADSWYGMTYREDTPQVRCAFRDMTAGGVYRKELFADWGRNVSFQD